MKKTRANPEVDAWFSRAGTWRQELKELRAILLDGQLDEELKWSKPCYSFAGKNVVILQPFKAYLAVLFFKGFLLKDPQGVLVKTGENTRVGRQLRFRHVREIAAMESVLKAYIREAIEVEKAGVTAEPEAEAELQFPEEFERKLAKNPGLRKAFDSLTPGRKRGYHIYFSAARQSKTRESRIDKCVPRILQGKGYNER